jgi:hypothetical protein
MEIGPDYLQNKVNENYSQFNIKYKNWFNELHWKKKLCFNGIEKFNITFSGKIIENTIVEKDNYALIINVIPVETNNKITIFDERYHGYNALLIENNLNKELTEDIPFIDKDGKNIFEIIVCANYSVDFDDEYKGKEELELINGKIKKINNIRRNAFDFFGIIIKNELGNVYNILEMELV